MAAMAHDESLLRLERAGRPTRPPGASEADAMRRSNEVYGFVTDVAEIAQEGWYGDPQWATTERAASFPEVVVEEIIVHLTAIGALSEGGDHER
jgi:creatinine amidohydrolase